MTEIEKVRFFGRSIVEVMLDVISISTGNDWIFSPYQGQVRFFGRRNRSLHCRTGPVGFGAMVRLFRSVWTSYFGVHRHGPCVFAGPGDLKVRLFGTIGDAARYGEAMTGNATHLWPWKVDEKDGMRSSEPRGDE